MKYLGQHFLVNRSVIKKIISAINLQPEETVLEIGPGHGELTEVLSHEFPKTKIVAVEKDTQFAAALKERFLEDKKVSIVYGDVLKLLPSLVQKDLCRTTYKIVGNIPYYLTGYLLRQIGEIENKPASCVFMVQKEVAERLVARPPEMNRLAASVQFWAVPRILAVVPRNDFRPIPSVSSAIMKLETILSDPTRKRGRDTENYFATVRILFAQPRKTIANNLLGTPARLEISKEGAIKTLEAVGIDPRRRPQNLTVDNIINLSRLLFSEKERGDSRG